MEIKLEIWKESGKWYTTEEITIDDIYDIPEYLESLPYRGMSVTVYYYVDKEAYYQPYRMYRL